MDFIAIPFCELEPSYWLLFGANVPELIYYTQIPNLLISLLLAFLVLLHNRRALSNRILFVTLISFCTWIFFNQIFWATNRGDIVMFSWLIDILVEPLVHIGIFYLLYVLLKKQDLPFYIKLFFGLLYLPIPILLPSALTLSGLDLASCLANEGPIALYYTYLVEITATLFLIVFLITQYLKAVGNQKRKEVLFLGIGGFLLLLAFSFGNITGSFTENWELGQYGLFGMPLFIAFLVYSMVKYNTFQTKIFGSEALVGMASCMLFALLFVTDLSKARWIIGLNLFLFALLGYQLVLSVKKEILQRELLQKKDAELEEINAQQEGLLHFITHEVKGYLTKSKAMFAAIVENDFPGTPDNLKVMAGQALADTQRGVETVRDILDSSNLKRGTTEYNKSPFNFKVIVEESVKEFEKAVHAKNLTLSLDVKPGEYIVSGDEQKIRRHVIRNLIDNAIKYTPQGSITVSVSRVSNGIIFAVQDTGVGIGSDDMKKLFTEGGKGKDSIRINVDSTGYGLYIAKVVVEAHKGTISAVSGGEGKGSTFTVTLPL